MLFNEAVESIGTLTDLKRIASAYVIDYRNLSQEEIVEALKKTAPQYYHEQNIIDTLENIYLNPERNIRIISIILLKNILLNKDNFMELQKDVNKDILEFEKKIINDSNELTLLKQTNRGEKLDLFKFIIETAWQNNDNISPDEKNLLEKIKNRLSITDYEYQILEAQIGRFPKNDNEIHTNSEIEEVRRFLQSKGLIFSIRDGDKNDYDLIPKEIVDALRKIFGIEMKEHGYRELLKTKYVRTKKYLVQILNKGNVETKNSMTVEELQNLCLERIKPTILLGGYSPFDGLNTKILSKWCKEIDIPCSGQKTELINRIIDYYDGIFEKPESTEDPRALLIDYFEDLAARNLDKLRKQGVIQKDLECEHLFEQATNYIFEKFLNHKPLLLRGNEQPDGILSFGNKFILWDNKSKETDVNLKDHIKQFDRYIRNSEKSVASFLVIGPSFTEASSKESMKYSALNETNICLISAKDFKKLALDWFEKEGDTEKSFPLGFFRQNGEFDLSLIDLS
ncbi:hypothetical protein C0585_05130 [Candidatus Woesearchaeota archaeon]|nr:MAG: hypothetical protein C0585_05130 [Candidatus Woesearchaeota archaeon]